MSGATMKKDEMERLISLLDTPPPAVQPSAPDKKPSAYDTHIQLQESAIRLLAGAGATAAAPSIMRLLSSPEASLREAAINGLIAIGDRSIVPALITSLSSQDPVSRESAARVLGGLGDPRATAPLMNTLSNDTEQTVRAAAAKALGTTGSTNLIQPLTIALEHDSSPLVRSAAARALVAIRNLNPNASVLQPLINGLIDPNADVRTNVIDALGDLRNLDRAEKLRIGQMLGQVVAGDSDRFVRSRALGLLGATAMQTNDRGMMALIGQALQSNSDPMIRRSASMTLSSIGGPAALSEVIRALPNNDPSVRALAAETLGRMGDMRAMQALQTAQRTETNQTVRSAIDAAIEAINRANGRAQALPADGRQQAGHGGDSPRLTA